MMEEDPIIPAVAGSSNKDFSGSRDLRHLNDEEEEFPKDENPAVESMDDDETPVGLKLLAEHPPQKDNAAAAASSSANDDMNYIDIKSFQKQTKSPKRNSSSKSSKNSNKKPPVDLSSYNMPENTIRNRPTSLEEDRRQLELEKEAFEKSKAKHTAQMEKSVLDVDETIDTTQSSEQKFLSLEDVKGIFQDVKGSGILNCGGVEALNSVNDGDNANNENNMASLYEDSALLGRITSGIRDSIAILSPSTHNKAPKEDEIPMEIAIPTPQEDADGNQQPAIDTQISSLDRLEEDHQHQQQQQQQQQKQQQKQPTIMETIEGSGKGRVPTPPPPPPAAENPAPPPPPQVIVEENLFAGRQTAIIITSTPERNSHNANNNNITTHTPNKNIVQMSPLERKVSKVILQQMQDEEEARLEKERAALQKERSAFQAALQAPESVIDGITFLRNKAKAREKLEAQAKSSKELLQQQQQQEEKKQEEEQDMDNKEDEPSDLVVQENDSDEGPFGTLKKVLTHIYNPSGGDNEITLEEYEEKVLQEQQQQQADEPPPESAAAAAGLKPTTSQESSSDQDVVHEKSAKKKTKKTAVFQKYLHKKINSNKNHNKSKTTNVVGDEKSTCTQKSKTQKLKNFFSKNKRVFKTPFRKQGGEEIRDA